MEDPLHILTARRCYLAACEQREMLARCASQRVVYIGELPLFSDPKGVITEMVYPEDIRPLVQRANEIIGWYGRGVQALLSREPVDEQVAADCFRRACHAAGLTL